MISSWILAQVRTRKMFLVSSQPWTPKQGCHHGFSRDEIPLSTTYAVDYKHYQWQKYCSLLYVSNLSNLKTGRDATKKAIQ